MIVWARESLQGKRLSHTGHSLVPHWPIHYQLLTFVCLGDICTLRNIFSYPDRELMPQFLVEKERSSE